MAGQLPFSRLLGEKERYTITVISQFAQFDEDIDESKRLCDVQPYFCMIQVAEKRELTEALSDYKICKDIGNLIGKSLEDYQTLKNEEVEDFRHKMARLGEETSYMRSKMNLLDKLLYHYPLRLAKSPQMPDIIRVRLQNDGFFVAVKLENETSFGMMVKFEYTPEELKEITFQKMNRTNMAADKLRTKDYILKVSGRDEYLFGNYPLCQFTFIQVGEKSPSL